MEILEEKIKKFLQIDDGSGDGYGYSSGDGFGYGSGDGSGDGYGDGYGSGYGSGDGSGDGYGDGSGYGSGDGSGSGYSSGDGFGSGSGDGSGSGYSSGDGFGYGSGDGSGDGYGDGIKSFNNKTVYIIDYVQTIIIHIYNNIAKGFILNKDLSLEPCYIAKGHNLFAHGKTAKKAISALQEKIFENLNTEEAIEEFRKKFKNTDKYKGTEFYTWHHILTKSCEMGRNNFVKNHNIDLKNEFTVKEFIEITKNDYGGEIIKKLKEYYK